MALCKVCEDEFSDRRAALGYTTCLRHGEPKKEFLSIPVNKSNPVVGTLEELAGSSHKGTRTW